MPTRPYTQSAKVYLYPWPPDPNQYGSSSHHPQLTSGVWKWLGKNCSLYPAHKVLYTVCQSWPWPLTLGPKINRVTPLIIHDLHVKFESDWAKTVVAIVSTRSFTQSDKVDLDLWPCDPKSIGFLFSSSTTYGTCEVWKWLGKNCSLYRVHKDFYTEYQSWPWLLTPWPKINRVPPLIIHNLPVHVKFESDWAKTVVIIVSTRYKAWRTHAPPTNPLTHSSNHPRTAALLYPFQSCCAKTVVAIVSTRSYTQSAKVDLDLWPQYPKSIGLLLSSSTTYMWSLKAIGQKL